MLAGWILRRQFHIASGLWSTQPSSVLATLRKKTGYTFANCKKALEVNNNDVVKAEAWLKEQAQSMGWTKATKLQGRQTTQGLIGVLSKNNIAAMVELNCETDFVARNEHFQNMVDTVANACLQKASEQNVAGNLVQLHLDADDLKSLKLSDGKTLADHLALMIGTVGENASLRRALIYKSNDTLHLSSYAHPSGVAKNETQLGKFGGLVALTKTPTPEATEDLGKKLCQHIVGMHPNKLGTENDEPAKDVDDEKCLIYQEYLLDDSLLVGEVLKENGVEIVEFKRFECGEEPANSQALDSVETCQ